MAKSEQPNLPPGYVRSGATGNPRPMTKVEARARLQELKAEIEEIHRRFPGLRDEIFTRIVDLQGTPATPVIRGDIPLPPGLPKPPKPTGPENIKIRHKFTAHQVYARNIKIRENPATSTFEKVKKAAKAWAEGRTGKAAKAAKKR